MPTRVTKQYNLAVMLLCFIINPLDPLDSKGDYSATSNNMKLVHWPLMGRLLHLVQRGGDWAGPQPAQAPPHCTSVTAHPSTASVPITVLPYNGPLLCGFNVGIKGLKSKSQCDLFFYLTEGCPEVSSPRRTSASQRAEDQTQWAW